MKGKALLVVLLLLPVWIHGLDAQQLYSDDSGNCTVVIMFCPSNTETEIKSLDTMNISINRKTVQEIPLNSYITVEIPPEDLLFYFSCRDSNDLSGSQANNLRTEERGSGIDYFSAERLRPEPGETYYLCAYRPSYTLMHYRFQEDFLEENNAQVLLASMTEIPLESYY